MEDTQKVVVYTDGGSRGNPGEAALGVVIKSSRGDVIKRYGERLGVKTNNEAEYAAVAFGLKKLKQLYGKEKTRTMHIEMRMDSELVCKQLSAEYKIENENLFPLFISIWNLRQDFDTVTFTHVSREKNQEADRMVNEALDGPDQGSLL